MLKRRLGKSDIEVSPMGLGGMPFGGAMMSGEGDGEYRFFLGEVDDKETIRTIHKAMDLGINFFDTAPAYGAGHSELLLGQAFVGRRDKVVIATKFGKKIDEDRKWFGRYTSHNEVIQNIRNECEGSLRRLRTDYIDLYQLHLGNFPLEQAPQVRDVLEELVTEGIIRYYGWSTNHPDRGHFFAQGEHCTALQIYLNVCHDTPEMLDICDQYNLGSVIMQPLAAGFLTGKYSLDNLDQFLVADDHRLRSQDRIIKILESLDAVQEILTSDGRTIVQGALGWIWARSDRTIPIPGFRTIAQVEENIKAMEFGPLQREQMIQFDGILKDSEAVRGF